MFDAIDNVMKAKGRLGELRGLFCSRRKAEELSFAPMRFPYLNRTQEAGVNKVLYAKDVAIVHGLRAPEKPQLSLKPYTRPCAAKAGACVRPKQHGCRLDF